MGEYQGILFDMDGVLVDSEPLFLRAINRVLVNEGVNPLSEEENEQFLIGTTVEETWRRLREEQLNEARSEGQRLLEQAREAAERFRTEEMDRARQEAEAFVERARSDIHRERDAAIEEVRSNFGELAITAAERVIRTTLDRQAHEVLISQVLEEGESLRRQ